MIFWILPTFFPGGLDIFLILGPEGLESVATNEFVRLGWGIAGTLMVALGVMLVAVGQPKDDNTFSQQNLVYLALELWYILDSLTSFVTKFYLNIVSNTVFLIVGILATRTYYSKQRENISLSGSDTTTHTV